MSRLPSGRVGGWWVAECCHFIRRCHLEHDSPTIVECIGRYRKSARLGAPAVLIANGKTGNVQRLASHEEKRRKQCDQVSCFHLYLRPSSPLPSLAPAIVLVTVGLCNRDSTHWKSALLMFPWNRPCRILFDRVHRIDRMKGDTGYRNHPVDPVQPVKTAERTAPETPRGGRSSVRGMEGAVTPAPLVNPIARSSLARTSRPVETRRGIHRAAPSRSVYPHAAERCEDQSGSTTHDSTSR